MAFAKSHLEQHSANKEEFFVPGQYSPYQKCGHHTTKQQQYNCHKPAEPNHTDNKGYEEKAEENLQKPRIGA